MKLVSAWLKIPFWQRVVAGFVLGALAGWLMGPAAGTWLKPLGDLYVTLIKMIAVPLVFFAVINAVASLSGQKSIAALAGRTFLWFAITAALAVGVGLAFGWVLKPGIGVGVESFHGLHQRGRGHADLLRQPLQRIGTHHPVRDRLPRLAHLRPGSCVRFEAVNLETAHRALRDERDRWQRWLTTRETYLPPGTLDETALYTGNLVDGVVHALGAEYRPLY